MNHARRDIMLVKLVRDSPLRKLLLPTVGGEHARLAEECAASLIRLRGGLLTVCSVVPPDATKATVETMNERLDGAMARITEMNGLAVDSKIIRHASIGVSIIQEAKRYDAVVVGAAGRSIYTSHCQKLRFFKSLETGRE